MTPVWNNQLNMWDVCSECRSIALANEKPNVDETGRFEINVTRKTIGSLGKLGLGNTAILAEGDPLPLEENNFPVEAHEVKDFLEYMLEDIDSLSVNDLVGYDVSGAVDVVEGN